MRKKNFLLAGILAAACIMSAMPVCAAEPDMNCVLPFFGTVTEAEDASSEQSVGIETMEDSTEEPTDGEVDQDTYKIYRQFFGDKYGVYPSVDLTEEQAEPESEETEMAVSDWYGYFRSSYPVHLELREDGTYTLDSYATHTSMDGTYENLDGTLVLHTGDGYMLNLAYIDENSLYTEADGYVYDLVRGEAVGDTAGAGEAEAPAEDKETEEDTSKETMISSFLGNWTVSEFRRNGQDVTDEEVADIESIDMSISESGLQLLVKKASGSKAMLYTQNVSFNGEVLHFTASNFGAAVYMEGDLEMAADGTLTMTTKENGDDITIIFKRADKETDGTSSASGENQDFGVLPDGNCWDGNLGIAW